MSIEELKEYLRDFGYWIEEYWMHVLLGTISVILIIFIGWFIKWHVLGIDSGYVYDKTYEPASCITTYIYVNKTMVPNIQCHGDLYKIWYRDGDKSNYDEIPSFEYQVIKIGQFYDRNEH